MNNVLLGHTRDNLILPRLVLFDHFYYTARTSPAAADRMVEIRDAANANTPNIIMVGFGKVSQKDYLGMTPLNDRMTSQYVLY